MNTLEDIPFTTPLGPLQEEVQLVTAPDITLPDCHRILQETEYGFNLEKWILTGQQPVCQFPSCPPCWMMFSSPQEIHRNNHRSSDMWAQSPRPRSHSLNSADTRWLHHRTVKFLVFDSEDEDGYHDDNEASYTDDALCSIKSRVRPRSAATRDPLSRVKDMHLGPLTHHCKPVSPQSLGGRRSSLPSPQDHRQPLRALEQHGSQQASPLPKGHKNSKKKQRSPGSRGKNYSQNTSPAPSPSRLQKQRPSSAGSVVKNRRQKTYAVGGDPFTACCIQSN